jgi:hypothetical protein
VKQQTEAVEKPFIVRKYRYRMYTCSGRQIRHTAAAKETGNGLFLTGPIALAAYLKGCCPVLFRALKGFSGCTGIVISSRFLAKQIKKAGWALESGGIERGEASELYPAG